MQIDDASNVEPLGAPSARRRTVSTRAVTGFDGKGGLASSAHVPSQEADGADDRRNGG
jgi:hypothetical protein